MRVLLARCLFVTCVLRASHSLGQGAPPDDLAVGRQLFAEALDDEDHGRFEAALEKYRRVLKIRETAAVDYRVGVTLEALGRKSEAVESYGAAVRSGKSSTDGEIVRASQARLDAIEPKLAHLGVRLAPGTPSDVVVRVDDVPIREGALGDIRLDHGTHVVTVTAGDGRTSRAEIVLSEGSRAEIPMILEPQRTEPTERKEGAPLRTIGVVTGIGGAVMLGAGIVALVVRSNAVSELQTSCPEGNCPATREHELRDTHDRALLMGPVGGVLVGAGVLVLGTGVVLFTLGRHTGTTAARLVPGTNASGGWSLRFVESF